MATTAGAIGGGGVAPSGRLSTIGRESHSTWQEERTQNTNVRDRASVLRHREMLDCTPDPKLQYLARSPLFRDLSLEQFRELAAVCEEISYSSEEIIFLQGESVRRVHMVASGVVRVSRFSETGKETLLRLEKPGDLLDDSLGIRQMHSVCARAKEASVLLGWEMEQFTRLSNRIAAIERNMVRITRSRLQALQERFIDLSTRPVPQRLARLVLQLAEEHGDPVMLSREEMAQVISSSLFTVSRLLSSWAESQIVTLDRRAVLIEDMDRLRELAEDAWM